MTNEELDCAALEGRRKSNVLTATNFRQPRLPGAR